jgi:cytochrome c oxidase subunit 3
MSESAFLRPPWKNIERQHQAVTLGIWTFLVSEVLLFAGLFAAYSVYRILYPEGFLAAGRETDIVFGTVNTFVLMTSSLTMAVSGRAVQAHLFRVGQMFLAATLLLGVLFLILKGFEYREDVFKHLVPGPQFPFAEPGAQLFSSFYWLMTGLHACHVTGGLIAVFRLLVASRRDARWLAGSGSQEATALYWHLVDVIWIILYPLLYLVGRVHG